MNILQFFLSFWAFIIGAIVVWHTFFWIDRFDQKNGIKLNEANSWNLRVRRMGALMWLAATVSMPEIHGYLRKTYEKNLINARYLSISPAILKK